nr:MAG TPA: hypothetical protein [Caudoviricetes sp.]
MFHVKHVELFHVEHIDLVENEDYSLFRHIGNRLDVCMICFVPIAAVDIQRRDGAPRIGYRITERVTVMHNCKNSGLLNLGVSLFNSARVIRVNRLDRDAIGRFDVLPKVYILEICVAQIVIMIGNRINHRLHLFCGRRQHTKSQIFSVGMTQNRLSVDDCLEHLRTVRKQSRDARNPCVCPTHERRKIFRLLYGLSGQLRSTFGVVFSQQMYDSGILLFIENCSDEIRLKAATDVLNKRFLIVLTFKHAHRVESTKFVSAGKCNVELILEDCKVLLIYRSTVKISLKNVLFVDLIHINAFAIAKCVVRMTNGVIRDRPLKPLIIAHLTSDGGQLADGVTVARQRHFQRAEFCVVGSVRKNRAAPDLRNCIDYRIIAGFKGGLRNRHKILWGLDVCNGCLPGSLLNNLIQYSASLTDVHIIHLLSNSFLFGRFGRDNVCKNVVCGFLHRLLKIANIVAAQQTENIVSDLVMLILDLLHRLHRLDLLHRLLRLCGSKRGDILRAETSTRKRNDFVYCHV